MHIEDCLAENKKQMSVMGESIAGENVTIELNEVTQSGTGQECTSYETAECKGECSKQLPEVHQTENNTSTITEDKESPKQCSDITKELSGLHIGDPQKTENKVRNVFQHKDIVRIEHQNTNSELDDEHATSRNSRAEESTSSVTQKTNKSKKSKSKKNKRKKSSQPLTPEERASLNKLMKDLITNEVRRSSKNKTLMSQQDGSRIHRTSQGESADSSCGLEETGGVDCRKAKTILNGVSGMHDYSDSFQSLTDNGESLPCSAYSDYRSEDSCSDSGKGGSDIQCAAETYNGNDDCTFMYTFEVPHDLCGALIGKHGRLINSIQDQSSTKILVREHYTYVTKLCSIGGTEKGIKKALHLIRKRFPIQYFPALTLEEIAVQAEEQLSVPEEAMQLRLPEGVACEVIVSSMLCPGWLFLQQPTHPTYSTLPTLVRLMTDWYNQMKAPGIGSPKEGNLCAVPGVNGWYRAKVTSVYSNNEECEVKFVDYGGYSRMSVSLLRQIYKDFFTLPFQAQECVLGNVKPIHGEEWSAESVQIFEELAIGSILQAVIVGYTAEGSIPIVHLFKSTCNLSSIFINEELVTRGAAQWWTE